MVVAAIRFLSAVALTAHGKLSMHRQGDGYAFDPDNFKYEITSREIVS